jgi:hypothetical protein
LRSEEYEYVFGDFLFFYQHHLENNPDSLICRIYGIYKVRPTPDSDSITIMVMRNAMGSIKKVNILI